MRHSIGESDAESPRAICALVTLLVLVLIGAGCAGSETQDEEALDPGPVITGEGGSLDGPPGPYGGAPAGDVANLSEALDRPAVYNRTTVVGQATVAEVVSERGFWLESDGNYVFTLLREREPDQENVALRPGHVLQLTGELRSTDDITDLESQIEPHTAAILERQDFFLIVSSNEMKIVTRGVAHPSLHN